MKRRRFVAAVLCFVALAAAGAGLRPALAAAGVSSRISSILQKHGVAGGDTGVYVWDFDAARQVFASHEDTRLAPASNMKLVTTSSALDIWGPQHRFKTELYGPDVPVYQGVLYGNLYLKGFGDPSLSTLSYQREVLHFTTASFESFAKRLRTLKVRKVKGQRARRRELVRPGCAPDRRGDRPCSSSAGRCRRSPATRASTTAIA